jgi:hypothetical protein
MKPDFLSRRDALGEGHPSRLELDRLQSGELTQSSHVGAHVAQCAECTDRLRIASEADQSYGASTFFAKEAQEVMQRAALSPPRRKRPWASVAIGIVALAASLLLVTRYGLLSPAVGPIERVKGNQPDLKLYRNHLGVVSLLNDGDSVRSGDGLRFEVRVTQTAWVAIIGVDAQGTVTAYSPSVTPATPVEPGVWHLLHDAVQLDETPGVEQVEAVFCDHAFAVEQVVALIRSKTQMPAGCTAVSRSLPKER